MPRHRLQKNPTSHFMALFICIAEAIYSKLGELALASPNMAGCKYVKACVLISDIYIITEVAGLASDSCL